jgi:hypothetical protein
MKVNLDYLKEFCNYHFIFPDETLSEENIDKLNYNFGIEKSKLFLIKSINDLEEMINKYSQLPTEADEDTNRELVEMLALEI